MILYFLVSKVEEYNKGRVKKMKRIRKIKGIEKIKKVKKVKKAIVKIR